MANTIEHKIPKKIKSLLNVQSGEFGQVKIVGTGATDYYPSLDENGNQMSVADYSMEEILAAKVKRQRLTVRLSVEGNAAALEGYVRNVLGYDAMAIADGFVDVYVPLMAPSEQCKAAGLKNLEQLSQITGVSVQTLVNWSRAKPRLFQVVILGAVVLHKG